MILDVSTEVLVVVSLINAGLCALVAHRQERNPYLWFAVGFFIGLFGVALLAFIPKQQNPKTGDKRNKDSQVPPNPITSGPITFEPEVYNWYYIDADKQTVGPISQEKLNQRRLSGAVSDKTFVWNESMIDWKRLKEVEDQLPKLPLETIS
jgi:hypothetical protein